MRSYDDWRGGLMGLLAVLVLWWIISGILKWAIIPSPVLVILNIFEIFTAKMQIHAFYSLGRIAGGILISLLIGVPVGYLMGAFEKVNRVFSPIVYFTYPVPKLALLPIVMLLFGLGESTKIIMIVLIVVFQIIITSRDAVRSIPREMFRSLQSLGASRWQVFSEIVFPATLSEVLTATRLALGTAVSILFFTETFGTEYGMGYFIMDSWLRVNYLDMYSGILVLSIIGFLLFMFIDVADRSMNAWR